ncbi:MAG TPA: hypothetical protein VGL99_16930 [Chloroflexota bacterium]
MGRSLVDAKPHANPDELEATARRIRAEAEYLSNALDAGAAEIRRYLRELRLQKERLPLPPGKR